MKIHIVLVEPEIPQNTGNISRTCAAVGAVLHLVKPLGFSLEDRLLKRAGLDYWKHLEVIVHEDFDGLFSLHDRQKFFFSTTKAERSYVEVDYPEEVFLVFGKETRGLDEKLLAENEERCVRIPMQGEIRSLNLSNAVAVITYEALRQHGFPGLMIEKGRAANEK